MAIISCPKCGQSVSSEAVSCPNCNGKIYPHVMGSESKLKSETNNSEIFLVKKYHALRTISSFFKLLGWVSGILDGMAIIGVLGKTNQESSNPLSHLHSDPFLISVAIGVILVAIGVIILFAISEIIIVFIDIEENTRLSVLLKNK